jgi:hypothetical protein
LFEIKIPRVAEARGNPKVAGNKALKQRAADYGAVYRGRVHELCKSYKITGKKLFRCSRASKATKF